MLPRRQLPTGGKAIIFQMIRGTQAQLPHLPGGLVVRGERNMRGLLSLVLSTALAVLPGPALLFCSGAGLGNPTRPLDDHERNPGAFQSTFDFVLPPGWSGETVTAPDTRCKRSTPNEVKGKPAARFVHNVALAQIETTSSVANVGVHLLGLPARPATGPPTRR